MSIGIATAVRARWALIECVKTNVAMGLKRRKRPEAYKMYLDIAKRDGAAVRELTRALEGAL